MGKALEERQIPIPPGTFRATSSQDSRKWWERLLCSIGLHQRSVPHAYFGTKRFTGTCWREGCGKELRKRSFFDQ